MIDSNNIEQNIIEYIDGELSNQDVLALEKFLKDNPQYQSLLEDYKSTIIIADDTIKYSNTESLLKIPNYKTWYWVTGIIIIASSIVMLNTTKRNTITEIKNINTKQHTPSNLINKIPAQPNQLAPKKPVHTESETASTKLEKSPIRKKDNFIQLEHKTSSNHQTSIEPLRGIPEIAMIPYTVEINLQYIKPLSNNNTDLNPPSIEINYPFKNLEILSESVEQIHNFKEKITDGLQNLKPSNIINEE